MPLEVVAALAAEGRFFGSFDLHDRMPGMNPSSCRGSDGYKMSTNKTRTIRKALEFLADAITAEAERTGIPLSEVEQKMLYFSETAWTLPNILEINEEFERSYNTDEYESKIAGLIQSFLQRAQTENPDELEKWSNAVERISEEDYYLQVMINAAPTRTGWIWRWLPTSSSSPLRRQPGDRWRLIVFAIAFIVGMVLINALLTWLFGPDWRHFGSQVH